MSIAFEVREPGLLSTVQDCGRFGHQRAGVPVGGAMDPFALQVGNLLVGNERGAAGLEMAMLGPTIVARRDTLVCLCGADLGARIGGSAMPPWKSILIPSGEEMRFQGPVRGVWAYLCIAGGIDVPLLLGSRSTCISAAFGGLDGRALRRGDLVGAGIPGASARAGRSLHPEAVPFIGARADARAIPGPQDGLFTPDARTAFYRDEYEVTPGADRMGYRLQGAPLELQRAADILSDAAALGSVQVPPDGQPIVLMADRQTTGGYAKIATVASVDVPRIAQLLAGGRVRFTPVTVEEAQGAAVRQETFLQAFGRECGLPQVAPASGPAYRAQ